MKRLFLFLMLTVLALGLYSQPVKVGDEVLEAYETLHPYKGRGLVFEQVFHNPNSGYIAVHFSAFDLAPGDYAEISSPDGKFYYTYREKGKAVRGGEAVINNFWATHIPGDTAIVRLYSHSRRGGWGFSIDKWVAGYETHIIEALLTGMDSFDAQVEAICNSDDKEWAKCYEGTTMYDKGRAVARLLMNGSSACTGWLIGSEGHVMTNNHCVGSQSTADNTDFEFMAEGATCTTNCASWLACPGIVEASSGTLVKTDSALDYSLILLPTNITSTYGYLQLRDTLPTIGERIYIVQHPGAWGKQLAVWSDVDGGYCNVYGTNQPPCTGGPGDIGYYCDTAGGSSGSPVLAYSDHLVVSLHHCATCPNRGLPIPDIISHLGSALPNDAIGGGTPPDPPAAPTNLTANATACDRIDLAWTDNADNESGFRIERSTNGVNFGEIDTVGVNVTTYNDTTVAENTTYWYRVRAYNGAGNSAYTNIASDTTPTCPVVPPAAPSNLNLKGLPGRVELTWNDNSNNENGFRIYRGTTPSNLVPAAEVGANVTYYMDEGLARKSTYYYKVCAFNSNGESCTAVQSVSTK
jgi:lysyl endopeptidase